MAQIELAPKVADDIERILAHLAEHGISNAPERIGQIIQSIDILRHSPLIGRLVAGGKRELVIGRGVSGYIALYRYFEPADTVFVLALLSQREAGFRHG